MIKNKCISTTYKLLIIIFTSLSLCALAGIFNSSFTTRIFGLFTTMSNVLCLLYYLVDVIFLRGNNKDKPKLFKGMVIMNLVITMVIAHLILGLRFNFTSFGGAAFFGVHYLVPIMAIFDYILFDAKGKIKGNYPFLWLTFPILYLIAALVLGRLGVGLARTASSNYPYFFLDVDRLGIGKVLLISLLVAVSFLIVGYLILLFDFILGKIRKKIKTKKPSF